MSRTEIQGGASTGARDPAAIVEREGGLHQDLSPRQVAMIGLGSTIGTGLFLGSAISVKLAGPAVILSFLGGSLIALTVMWALAEMTAEHPAAGSFGLHAEIYLHPWAGFAVRYTYWLCLVVVVGSEVVAAAIYCKLWFPGVPSWIWVAAFSAAIVTALLLGIGFPRIGAVNYTGQGGFFPNGTTGVLLGITMAVFSFLGIEIVAATAGEAAEPRVAVPKALRRTLFFLVLFYLGGLTLVVGLVPWNQIGLGESPFVRVFQTAGIPAAGHVMNFVVLTAALSSAMCNLYFTARLLFSLARGGYAPAALGRLSKRGMPVPAVLASSAGMVAAMILSHYYRGNGRPEDSAFVFMIGLAFFGGPFIWIMILITHLAFRRANARAGRPILRFAPPGPWSSLFGLAALLGVLLSTWWVPRFRVTLRAGPPWLAFLTLCYLVWRKTRSRRSGSGGSLDG